MPIKRFSAPIHVTFPGVSSVKSAKYLKTGGPASFVPIEKGILLKGIPRDAVDEYDTIVVLEMRK